MLTAKLFFGVLLLVLSVTSLTLAKHLRQKTIALTAQLNNPQVRQRWIEREQPKCRAYEAAIRAGAVCIGAIGMALILGSIMTVTI
ncbi:MAG: hypothetical protein BGO63_03855 [Candidatus Accumulibacter sp. 66-26]|nr:MAG: hypothetical protein BGO63_03855 [Candidatus Accumulibacter sp. 66-26]